MFVAACAAPAAAIDASVTDAMPWDVAAADSAPDAARPDAAVEDVAPEPSPLTWDVRRPGPYATGYRTITFGFSPPGGGAERVLTFHLWYPTHATSGPHPRYFGLFVDPLSVVGAPLAPSSYGDHYPVHVYSHGDRGFGPTSHFLMRYFASHGWISIAPDHLGNTLSDTPDPRPLGIYYLRGLDVSAALDALEQLPATDPLSARTDTAHALLSGHSFGTHTVWTALGAAYDVDLISARCTPAGTCSATDLAAFRAGTHDPRFVAGIPMAGSISRDLFGPDGHRSVSVPLLSMSGSADPVGADAQFTTTAPLPLTWIDVLGACHQFFALGGCSDIANDQQSAIVGTYALAFARRHVLNDGDPTVAGVLDGSILVSSLV
ncbi:MAG: hypothetical protein WCJ30_21150, partial [Deltaproteobacteria bacterium]